jgi:hypothetical protein
LLAQYGATSGDVERPHPELKLTSTPRPKARLDEIIRDFPGTPSAEEAKRLRLDLGK